MGRAPCCEKVGLKRGRWTAKEDEILTKYIRANGEGSWRLLPKNAGLLRCGKSCRLRWINYLRPDVKRGKFSSYEEDVIIKLHASLGNRWSLIAGHLEGRTDNEIKNYWNSHLSRRVERLSISDQIEQKESLCVMDHIPRPEEQNAKMLRSKGPEILLASKKNKVCNSPPRLLEVKEDCNGELPVEPPMPFMEVGSSGDIPVLTNEGGTQCTRLPDQQSLIWTNIDLDKDLADGTILDSGFDDNVLMDDGFDMDFPSELLSDVNELLEPNPNPEVNANLVNTSSTTNSTSCISKESEENLGWDYLDGSMQGDVFWDTQQEKMLMSWLWETTADEGKCSTQ